MVYTFMRVKNIKKERVAVTAAAAANATVCMVLRKKCQVHSRN